MQDAVETKKAVVEFLNCKGGFVRLVDSESGFPRTFRGTLCRRVYIVGGGIIAGLVAGIHCHRRGLSYRMIYKPERYLQMIYF